ncbi:MAG: hypothetical protein HKN29_02620, partial [Rhodothermales bacterium]|nr:hypothetical protein [Rhodothermales bacterium]
MRRFASTPPEHLPPVTVVGAVRNTNPDPGSSGLADQPMDANNQCTGPSVGPILIRIALALLTTGLMSPVSA